MEWRRVETALVWRPRRQFIPTGSSFEINSVHWFHIFPTMGSFPWRRVDDRDKPRRLFRCFDKPSPPWVLWTLFTEQHHGWNKPRYLCSKLQQSHQSVSSSLKVPYCPTVCRLHCGSVLPWFRRLNCRHLFNDTLTSLLRSAENIRKIVYAAWPHRSKLYTV